MWLGCPRPNVLGQRLRLLCDSTLVINKLSVKIQTRQIAISPSLSNEALKSKLPHLLVKASTSRPPSHHAIQSLHAIIITMRFQFDQPIFLSNNLISAYASLDDLPTSRKVFNEMHERNSVSYNSIIAAYIHFDKETGAWELFKQMMGSGIRPTQFTFGSLLSSSSLSLLQGFELHTLIQKNGLFHCDAFSGTSLLGLFGRHGHLDEAVKLFEELPNLNVVTWNSIITSFGNHGYIEKSINMFCELLRTSIRPSEYSFVGILSGLGGLIHLETGKQIHGLLVKSGSVFHTSVANSLVNMYVRCENIFLAEELFEQLPVKDVITWNTIIGAFSKSSDPMRALTLFLTMSLHGFSQNEATFASVISSCASLQVVKYGELIHSKAIKNNFLSDGVVDSSLIYFYAKCNCLGQADRLFFELPIRNEASWNALILGHSINDSGASFSLIQQMLHEGYCLSEISLSAVLKSSSNQHLQQIHCLILKMGYHQHEYVSSSLINSYNVNDLLDHALSFATDSSGPLSTVSSNILAGIYNRRGQYEEAQKLLFQLEEFDEVSWNILISSYARSGDHLEGLELFKDMQLARILPDNCTWVSIICISTKLCNLPLGSAIHGQMIKMDFSQCDVFVCNVLLDMYAKCGNVEGCVKVFNEMSHRNLISWTALISGLGLHGYPSLALEKFREMELLGIQPDRVAFIAVLSACRHGGLVEEGMELFGKMKKSYDVEPEMDHYICTVDLLSRCGYLKEAQELIGGMPFRPNTVIWRTFLEGCRRYESMEEAAR